MTPPPPDLPLSGKHLTRMNIDDYMIRLIVDYYAVTQGTLEGLKSLGFPRDQILYWSDWSPLSSLEKWHRFTN